MPTKEELMQAIDNLEVQEPTFDTCHKLYVYNSLLDRYYGNTPTGVLYNSDSEFMKVAGHSDINKLYEVVDELMECLALVNPKLYNGVIAKLGS